MSDYLYRAYCDICNEGSEWGTSEAATREWRMHHFDDIHPGNPMVKQNCRIQRKPIEDVSTNY